MPTAWDYFVSTEAVEDCWALAWDRATIRRLAGCYPTLWENAFVILAGGVGSFVAVHASQTYDTAPQRVARVLLNLADALGQKIPTGIELSIRNEDLADAANVTLFTASRLLNEWQTERPGGENSRQGLVALSRSPAPPRSLGAGAARPTQAASDQ
ncbi:MAG: Crp/Fnr family transcriptional regulator [Candidatus Korobacteraceae bacterium]